MGLAERYDLVLVEREVVQNRYGVAVFMLLGLTGKEIPPVGLSPGRGDEVLLNVDFETDHKPKDMGVTREVFLALTEGIKEYKTKKAINDALKLKTSSKVNVILH
jgi:hypothetical protein